MFGTPERLKGLLRTPYINVQKKNKKKQKKKKNLGNLTRIVNRILATLI
jgi:hypothetical protein